MQSLNSPHHAMGPSMSPVGSPYMGSSMGMSGGGMSQCMGNTVGQLSRSVISSTLDQNF